MFGEFRVHYSGAEVLVDCKKGGGKTASRMYPLHELYVVRDESGGMAALHTFGEAAAVHVGPNGATEGQGCGEVVRMSLDAVCPTCGRHFTGSDANLQRGRCADCVLCPRCGVKTNTMMKESFETLLQCTNCGWCTQPHSNLNQLKNAINNIGYGSQPLMKARCRQLEHSHQLLNLSVVSISNEARGLRVYRNHHPGRTGTTMPLNASSTSSNQQDPNYIDLDAADELAQSTLAIMSKAVQQQQTDSNHGVSNDSLSSSSAMRVLGNFSFTSIAATATTRAAQTSKLEARLQAALAAREQGAPIAMDVSTLASAVVPADFSGVSLGRRSITCFNRTNSTALKTNQPLDATSSSSRQPSFDAAKGDGIFVNVLTFVAGKRDNGGGASTPASTIGKIQQFVESPFSYDRDIFTFDVPGKDGAVDAHFVLPTACVPTTVHPNITAAITNKSTTSNLLQQGLTNTCAQLYSSALTDSSSCTSPAPNGLLAVHTKQMNATLQGVLPGARGTSLRVQGDMPGSSSQYVQYTPLVSRDAVILTHPIYSSVDSASALHLPPEVDVLSAINASPTRSKAGGSWGDAASSVPGNAYLYVPNPKGLLDSKTTGGLLNKDRNPHLNVNMNAARILPHLVVATSFERSPSASRSPQRQPSTTAAEATDTDPAVALDSTLTLNSTTGESLNATASKCGDQVDDSDANGSRMIPCFLWNFGGTDIKVTEISVAGTKGCTAVCTTAIPGSPQLGPDEGDQGELYNAAPQPPLKPLTMFLTSRSNDIEALGSTNVVTTRELEGLVAAANAIKATATTSTDSASSPNPVFFPCESRVLFGIDVTVNKGLAPNATKMVCLKITAVVSVGRHSKVETSYLSYLTFV